MRSTKNLFALLVLSSLIFISCNNKKPEDKPVKNDSTGTNVASPHAPVIDRYDPNFILEAESFADLQILRYQVPGFNELPLQQKQLAYYLYEAALSGFDIIYDQKSKNGLTLRKTLETVYTTYKGDTSAVAWKQFTEYCGRVWFSNGNHHHYGNEKFIPACSFDYFSRIVKASDTASLPKENGESVQAFLTRIKPVVYDLKVEPKLVDLTADIDNVKASSVNFYEGVTQKEVDSFYAAFPKKDSQPSWGLNSKVMKENGKVVEKIWKSGGMYGAAIDKIIGWLEKASGVAENAEQKKAIDLLIQYYRSGDLVTFDQYSLAWIRDVNSRIDVVNGFIEQYLDPIAKKGSFESIVSMKDLEATKRIKAIADQAQWFEDNSPLMAEHKKKPVHTT